MKKMIFIGVLGIIVAITSWVYTREEQKTICCSYTIQNRMPYLVDYVEFLYDNIIPIQVGYQSLIEPGETRTWQWYVEYCSSYLGDECKEKTLEAITLIRVVWHDEHGDEQQRVTEPISGGYKGNWRWYINEQGNVLPVKD